MFKRLTTLYIALHLAFGPVAGVFASTCLPMMDTGSHEECTHHRTMAQQDQHSQNNDSHRNCHESEQDKNTHDRCNCDCPASTAGLIHTFFPRLADNVIVLLVSPAETQHSVTGARLFKPPRV